MCLRLTGLMCLACLAMIACDPGADGDATGPYYQECKTKGVWVDGGLEALVRPSGKAQLILPDGFQYQGTVEGGADGGIVCELDRNTFRAALPPGASFPDGSTSGEGKVKGTIYVDSWLDMTLNIKTAAGTAAPVFASLSYDPVHRLDASLETIAGTYRSGSLSLSINAVGTMFGQYAGNGCVLNGTVAVIEGKFNLYELDTLQEGCAGEAAALNGLSGEGLGYYRPGNGVAPDRLTLAVIMPQGTRLLSSVWRLDRE